MKKYDGALCSASVSPAPCWLGKSSLMGRQGIPNSAIFFLGWPTGWSLSLPFGFRLLKSQTVFSGLLNHQERHAKVLGGCLEVLLNCIMFMENTLLPSIIVPRLSSSQKKPTFSNLINLQFPFYTLEVVGHLYHWFQFLFFWFIYFWNFFGGEVSLLKFWYKQQKQFLILWKLSYWI